MIRACLTDEQWQDPRLLARCEVGCVSGQAYFVLLSDQGKSAPEIASLFDYSAASVREWLKRCQAERIAGPYDRPWSDCLRKVDQQVEEQIVGSKRSQASMISGCLLDCGNAGFGSGEEDRVYPQSRLCASGFAASRSAMWTSASGYACIAPVMLRKFLSDTT